MSYIDAPVLIPYYEMSPRPTPCYAILQQEDREERGRPIAFFFDPFKARATFDALPMSPAAFVGGCAYQLVAYELYDNGTLMELQMIATK
jgi:hypothetical protein